MKGESCCPEELFCLNSHGEREAGTRNILPKDVQKVVWRVGIIPYSPVLAALQPKPTFLVELLCILLTENGKFS